MFSEKDRWNKIETIGSIIYLKEGLKINDMKHNTESTIKDYKTKVHHTINYTEETVNHVSDTVKDTSNHVRKSESINYCSY